MKKKKSLITCTRHGLFVYNKNLMKQQCQIQIFQLNLPTGSHPNIEETDKLIAHVKKKKSAEKMYQAWVHSRKCKCSWPELEVEEVLQILQYSTTRWPWPIQTQFTDKQLKRDTQSTQSDRRIEPDNGAVGDEEEAQADDHPRRRLCRLRRLVSHRLESAHIHTKEKKKPFS